MLHSGTALPALACRPQMFSRPLCNQEKGFWWSSLQEAGPRLATTLVFRRESSVSCHTAASPHQGCRKRKVSCFLLPMLTCSIGGAMAPQSACCRRCREGKKSKEREARSGARFHRRACTPQPVLNLRDTGPSRTTRRRPKRAMTQHADAEGTLNGFIADQVKAMLRTQLHELQKLRP